MEEIKNRVLKQDLIDYKSLEWIQGELKELTEENFERLIRSIVENDIVKAFHVWESEGKVHCLDGNHLKKALEEIERRKLKKVPAKFKADFIDCADMREAKRLVLVYSAVYARVTDEGLYDYLHANELVGDWGMFRETLDIPGMDMEGFEVGWLSNEYIIDDIPDMDIQGEVENKSEYLVINFDDIEEYHKFKGLLGLKGNNRTIHINDFKQALGLDV